MERFFEKRICKIVYLLGGEYPHSQKLNKDSVCNCDNGVTGCDLMNSDTGEVVETLFVCPECAREEKEKAAKKVREERIKNYVFRPEIQSKLDRGKRISKFDLAGIIDDINGIHSYYWLYYENYSREEITGKFNEIFGTDIK